MAEIEKNKARRSIIFFMTKLILKFKHDWLKNNQNKEYLKILNKTPFNYVTIIFGEKVVVQLIFKKHIWWNPSYEKN